MSFIELPLDLNGETLIDSINADMADAFPGWEPAPGNPETYLIRAIVYRLIVPLAQLAADMGELAFAEFGRQIANVQTIDAASATVQSTWTMIDDAGYTVPLDAQVDIAVTGDTSIGFRVLEEVLVAPGDTATAAGEVTLIAIEPGSAGDDLDGDASLVNALAYVDSIELVGASSGGSDAEDPLDYLSRLAETMLTFSPKPFLASDVEIIARSVPGVARATALDNYDPDTDDADDTSTWDSEGVCSVVPIDAEGLACSSPVKDAVDAKLSPSNKRIQNTVFHVLDPDYTTIDVNFEVTVLAGFAQADVEAAVISRLTDFLTPSNWGIGDQQHPTLWVNRRVVRYQDLSTLINDTQGVDFHTTLKLAANPAALGTADVTMLGAAPLPEPGTIQVGT